MKKTTGHGMMKSLALLSLLNFWQLSFPAEIPEKPTRENPLIADKERGEARILARFTPKSFSKAKNKMAGYHAVVWKNGTASDLALFQSYVSDRKLLAALLEIGAEPGNNLSQKTWDERENRKSDAAEERILGSPVKMFVSWEGLEKPLELNEILNDPGGSGVDLRLGGNEKMIESWHSGCIVCLYSCPGSKIGNHAYTLRDFVEKKTRFTVNFDRAPKAGTDVVIIFKIDAKS